eukprot:gene13065-biopygen7355
MTWRRAGRRAGVERTQRKTQEQNTTIQIRGVPPKPLGVRPNPLGVRPNPLQGDGDAGATRERGAPTIPSFRSHKGAEVRKWRRLFADGALEGGRNSKCGEQEPVQ